MDKKKFNKSKAGFRDPKLVKGLQSANRRSNFDEIIDESMIKELLEKMAYLEKLTGSKNFANCYYKP